MRIVSLLPAATDWLVAFGMTDRIVGRSHDCDAPEALDVPVLTRPAVDATDSADIDREVQAVLRRGLSLFEVDLDTLRALRPDLVVTQAQCDVCAVSLAGLESHLAGWTGNATTLVSLEPQTFKQALDAALRLARAAGCLPEAMRVLGAGEARLRALHERIGRRRDGSLAHRSVPTVACIEWLEPLMTAGHWMPDLVDLAGGRAVCSRAGMRSGYVTWESICAADPDGIAVAACGSTVEDTRRDLHVLTRRPGWDDLRAVRSGRAFLFDGNAYFNRPGPTLYRATELLAAAVHEDTAIEPEYWEMQSLATIPA